MGPTACWGGCPTSQGLTGREAACLPPGKPPGRAGLWLGVRVSQSQTDQSVGQRGRLFALCPGPGATENAAWEPPRPHSGRERPATLPIPAGAVLGRPRPPAFGEAKGGWGCRQRASPLVTGIVAGGGSSGVGEAQKALEPLQLSQTRRGGGWPEDKGAADLHPGRALLAQDPTQSIECGRGGEHPLEGRCPPAGLRASHRLRAPPSALNLSTFTQIRC